MIRPLIFHRWHQMSHLITSFHSTLWFHNPEQIYILVYSYNILAQYGRLVTNNNFSSLCDICSAFYSGICFLLCPNKQPWLSIHHHNKRAVQSGCCSPSITNIAYTAVSIIRYAEKISRTNAPCRESREIHVGLGHCGSLYLLIFLRWPDICICAVLPAIGAYCTTSKHYRPGRPFSGAHWSFSVSPGGHIGEHGQRLLRPGQSFLWRQMRTH